MSYPGALSKSLYGFGGGLSETYGCHVKLSWQRLALVKKKKKASRKTLVSRHSMLRKLIRQKEDPFIRKDFFLLQKRSGEEHQ